MVPNVAAARCRPDKLWIRIVLPAQMVGDDAAWATTKPNHLLPHTKHSSSLREAGGEIPPAYLPQDPDPGERESRYRPDLDLCWRRSAIRRARSSAALFYASRDRRGEHPARHLQNFADILLADAYSGFNALFDPGRKALPATPAFCWAHGRRAFFELADIAQNARRGRSATAISPVALEAVRRIDQLFEIERDIYGLSAEERLQIRRERSAPLLTDLEAWLRAEAAGLSRSSNVIKPINYLLNRWDGFARLVHDGRICMTNNAAERALRCFALGRKAWLFAGSNHGAERAAVMATLIMTARLNDIDPKAWLADVLARIANMPQSRLHELLPWNWTPPTSTSSAQAA